MCSDEITENAELASADCTGAQDAGICSKWAFRGAKGATTTPNRGMAMHKETRGFTLIELLIVVVIIGILAAIAIPKFAATKDKAKLASVKTDVRNSETAEESYFADFATFGSFSQLQAASNFSLSSGNTMTITAATNGYTVSANNPSISFGITSCQVTVAGNSSSTVDGIITCP